MIVVFKCLPVVRYYCLPHPVTWLYMAYAFCRGGVWGLAPQAFHCESIPTPLNLTYVLSYDCPWFARMRIFFHLRRPVNLSTCQPVDLSTCRLVNLSTCQPVTCNMVIFGVCILTFTYTHKFCVDRLTGRQVP